MQNEIWEKINLKTKPPGSLGLLEKVAAQTASVFGTLHPKIQNPTMLVFAGDHGATVEGISPFPSEVTPQMVLNFLNRGAAINVFSNLNDWNLKVIDAGVNYDFEGMAGLVHQKVGPGTKNYFHEKAMTEEELQRAFDYGALQVKEAIASGSNLISCGEMGIGNTSAASLIMSALLKIPLAECVGKGTGIDSVDEKTAKLLKAQDFHGTLEDPKEIMQTFGGFEMAQMAGAMMEVANHQCLFLVDGFIATASYLVAVALKPELREQTLFGHVSNEQGHQKMLAFLGAEPLLQLGMRLGEGTGAALALPLIKASVAFFNEMASFADAGVSNKE